MAQYSFQLFYGCRMTHLMPSYLINSFLTEIKNLLKTSQGALFLSPSDVYVRSFLYLFYTLIKPYYTKALRGKASSLAPDRIPLLQRPRIPVSCTACSSKLPFSVTFTYHSKLIDFRCDLSTRLLRI